MIFSSLGDEVVRVEIHSNEQTTEIFLEADFETLSEGCRRLGILNIPRHPFWRSHHRSGSICGKGAMICEQIERVR